MESHSSKKVSSGKSRRPVTPTFRRSTAAPTFSSQSGQTTPMATPKVGVASRGILSTVVEDVTKDSAGKDNAAEVTASTEEVEMKEGGGVASDKGEGPKKASDDINEALLAQQLLEKVAMSGLGSFMQLLSCLGQAYQALMTYDLGRAVQLFQSLPPHHWETPWVLGQVAQAYFSAERFEQSAKLFGRLHAMDPHRQDGMELYSSALWHLKREVELSKLVKHLETSNSLCPQFMCAMASLKNLYKDHETAFSFLLKATKECPRFAYAHTLLGHEYWLSKDYDKALLSFQEAVAAQPRHYNAWYGKAHVCFAQEKYQDAEAHAKIALAINGCSSISCTQMGLAQFRQGKEDAALASFKRALSINPFNPIPRFHKAKVLEAKGQLEESLEELNVLVRRWPKEPSIYISRGKILKRLNRTHEAALQFSWALDFSCSGQNSQLREEIDQTYHNQNSRDLRDDSDADFLVLSDSQEEEGEGEGEGEEEAGDGLEGGGDAGGESDASMRSF